jgi:hypothetical protein
MRDVAAARPSGVLAAPNRADTTESVLLSEIEQSPDAPVETERELLAKLKALVDSGTVLLTVDRTKLSSLDFPLGSEVDGNIWVYAMAAASVAIWWRAGMWFGIAAGIVSLILYQTLGKAYVARRLDRRIRERGLQEMDTWRALWRFGGVILTPAEGGAPCQGPQGSWFAVARNGGTKGV